MSTSKIDFSLQKESSIKAKSKRWLKYTIIVIVVALLGFIYFKYFFVFGNGVKAGQLNYVVYKGYVFKTYEGKLIQAGYKSGTAGPIQSYEFEFSISDKKVAEKLMGEGGKEVELHYKEYLGIIPWRGYSKYVVDSIIQIKRPSLSPTAE